MKRYYIGLATTFHDPALAIVGPTGGVLFAESVERHSQVKRAFNQDPDTYLRMQELLQRHCEPDAELVVATTWSTAFSMMLRLASFAGAFRPAVLRTAGSGINRALLRDDEELTYASFIHHMQEKAGMGVLTAARELFGHSRVRMRRFSHHDTHAAHACYTSPFSSAACAVVDGMGEFGSMAFYQYQGGRLQRSRRHWGRESLGFLYALITHLCGFDWRLGEEWKVMGLAAYGQPDPELDELLGRICRVENGEVIFAGRSVIRKALAGLKARAPAPGAPPMESANMACAGQRLFCRMLAGVLQRFRAESASSSIAFGGGCALNSSFNGALLASTGFARLYIPSAPGDDGNAIGAALLAYAQDHPGARISHGFQTPYLGSEISAEAVARLVRHHRGGVRQFPRTVHRVGAELLAQGKIVGWVQGRAEFGPRALGNRSILADPRDAGIRKRMSESVKMREDFRPFAPSILHAHGSDYFEDYQESPYMERAQRFRGAAAVKVPAVVHADFTGRAQTVKREWNPRFHDLIAEFRRITDIPLVLNTSFNVMGRPIIHSPEDAIATFYTTGLDALIIDDYVIEK